MLNTGYVVKVKPGQAEVLLGKHAQCVRCGGCLAAADDRGRRIEAANDLGAGVGALVEVEISPGRLVGAAFLMFMLPVFIALAAGYAGYRLALATGLPITPTGVGLGVVGFIGSFLILRSAERASAKSGLPRIVRILGDDEPEGRC
jgi:sigma-E factor negative regulatory protein RseC